MFIIHHNLTFKLKKQKELRKSKQVEIPFNK